MVGRSETEGEPISEKQISQCIESAVLLHLLASLHETRFAEGRLEAQALRRGSITSLSRIL